MSHGTQEKNNKSDSFKNKVKDSEDKISLKTEGVTNVVNASTSKSDIVNEVPEVKPKTWASKRNKHKKSNTQIPVHNREFHRTGLKVETDSFGKLKTLFEDDVKISSPEVKQNEYNLKALNKNDTTYRLEKFEKNFLIIFNQETIEGYKSRKGAKEDVKALKDTFSKFGFEIIEYKDLTQKQIFKKLQVFEEKDFTDYGCVAVVVLTHGTQYGLIRAKDNQYKESKIIKFFKTHNKPKLITKPKILIIQAYRGYKIFPKNSGVIRMDTVENLEPYTLPVESDMLIVHSTYTGGPANWDENQGSWFIQTLCSKIEQLAENLDLESIITEVKRGVDIGPGGDIDIDLQLLVHTSTLIRKLYLKNFGDKPIHDSDDEDTDSEIESETTVDHESTTPVPDSSECPCFLDHYSYIKDCLKYFVEAYPDDDKARAYLSESNTYENGVEFHARKEKMAEAICSHLNDHAKDIPDFEYIYMYKHNCDT